MKNIKNVLVFSLVLVMLMSLTACMGTGSTLDGTDTKGITGAEGRGNGTAGDVAEDVREGAEDVREGVQRGAEDVREGTEDIGEDIQRGAEEMVPGQNNGVDLPNTSTTGMERGYSPREEMEKGEPYVAS